MSPLQVEAVRRRVFHSLSPDTAQVAGEGTTLQMLQQFLCRNHTLSDAALTRLAHHLGVPLT